MKKHNASVIWADRPDRAERNRLRNEAYHRNKESICAAERAWRKANPEEARAADKRSYQRNKRQKIERARAYRGKHPEIRQTEYRNSREKRPWERPFRGARHRSLKKNFPFDLTREWCEANWTGKCAITNLPFSFGTQQHYPFSPSIDRVDSAKGYTQDNCRFVLFAVNSFKGTGTDEQMLQIAEAICYSLKGRTAQVIAPETGRRFGSEDVIADDHHALLTDLAQRHE